MANGQNESDHARSRSYKNFHTNSNTVKSIKGGTGATRGNPKEGKADKVRGMLARKLAGGMKNLENHRKVKTHERF